MNVFLTSQASEVLEKVLSMLPLEASEYSVLFIPTAANPYTPAPWVDADRAKLVELGFRVRDLDIEGADTAIVSTAVNQADIVFVAGGNTFYLLEHAKKSGFLEVAKAAVAAGKIYIGSSAGSVLAAPDIRYVELFDDSNEANLNDTHALGLVSFSILPHFGNAGYGELHAKVLREYASEDVKMVPVKDNEFAVPAEEGWQVIEA